jgi:hypothetical protein
MCGWHLGEVKPSVRNPANEPSCAEASRKFVADLSFCLACIRGVGHVVHATVRRLFHSCIKPTQGMVCQLQEGAAAAAAVNSVLQRYSVTPDAAALMSDG